MGKCSVLSGCLSVYFWTCYRFEHNHCWIGLNMLLCYCCALLPPQKAFNTYGFSVVFRHIPDIAYFFLCWYFKTICLMANAFLQVTCYLFRLTNSMFTSLTSAHSPSTVWSRETSARIAPCNHVASWWNQELQLILLPPANEVWGKIIISQVSVCPKGRGSPWQKPPPPRTETSPPYGQERAVGILLECILVIVIYSKFISGQPRDQVLVHIPPQAREPRPASRQTGIRKMIVKKRGKRSNSTEAPPNENHQRPNLRQNRRGL